MSDKITYTVMGDDGKEYGPVTAEQLRDWITENRLERKTPVKSSTAKDWVFLEMLPEFKGPLEAVAPAMPNESKGSRKWLVLMLLIIVLAGIVFLVLKK